MHWTKQISKRWNGDESANVARVKMARTVADRRIARLEEEVAESRAQVTQLVNLFVYVIAVRFEWVESTKSVKFALLAESANCTSYGNLSLTLVRMISLFSSPSCAHDKTCSFYHDRWCLRPLILRSLSQTFLQCRCRALLLLIFYITLEDEEN